MMKAYFVKGLCVLALFVPCFAQAQSPSNEPMRRQPDKKTESFEKARSESAPSRVFQRRAILPFKKRISREQKKILAPDVSDLQRYEVFLSQPNTGLIKLFPDIGCEEDAAVVRADEICLKAIPMSGFYSFREKEYTSSHLSDIRLKNDVLITDGLLTQGILVALGDVALETISLASGGMKFLNEFVPETQGAEALKQTKQIIKGINTDEHFYRKALFAKENMTYALRLIAYRGSFVQTFRGLPFDLLAGDERDDLTVAFRVLRKDKAGNLTILWKELLRKDAPKIKFPKRSRKSV
jgi:hypothetical protein